NQHCKHCYLDGGVHNDVAEMSTEQIKKIIKEFKEQDGRYLIITGGEPIMRTDIFEILDYIESLEIPFSFASNSLAMTPKRLEKLETYTCLDLYFTSILGADVAKHRSIAEKDSYDNVFEALSFFEKKGVSTYVQVTLAKDFVDDMEQIAEKLMEIENCIVKFTPIGTLGVKSDKEMEENKHLLVPQEEFGEFHKRVSQLQKMYPDRIEDCNIQNYEQVYAMIEDYKEEKLYSMCYGFIAVRPDGDISFSCNMENPYTFGKAYESIRVPIDEKLMDYIELLKKAEQATLEEAKTAIVEVDITVDRYIRELSN
ncbi:radical SAM protein, partial [Anaerosporobacter sp.]|uniref:radical SAM protein n=1 Tax=Anaerosporobacter sp. TaxID=1872529 RepID=UPI00286F63E3